MSGLVPLEQGVIGVAAIGEVFYERTGVRLRSMPLLVLLGAATILTSAPSLFRPGTGADWPAPARVAWDWLVAVAGSYRRWTGSDDVLEVLAIAAQAAVVLVLLVPPTILARSLWQGSAKTAFGVLASLLLGLFAIPLVLWLIVLLTAAGGLAISALRWLQQATQFLSTWVERIVEVVGVPLAVIIGVGALAAVMVAFVRSSEVRRWVLLIAGLAAALWVLDVLFDWSFLTSALGVVGRLLAVGLGWVLTVLFWAIAVIFVLGVACLSLGVAAGLVAQLGVALWSPFPGAWLAGRDTARATDFAAGIGVSASVIVTASSVAGRFSNRLEDAVTAGTVGDFLGWVPLTWGPLLPNRFEEALHYAFRGFSGIPEFGVLCVCCVLGIASLIVARTDLTSEPFGALASLALLRTTLALAMVLPALVLAALFSDDSG